MEQQGMEFQPIIENPELKTASVRLQAYLAHAGVASRRASEKLIESGRVKVNGIIVREMGTKVFPADLVLLDGVPVKTESKLRYLALNKPAGYICSSSDPQNRPLALNLLPQEIRERLYNVGRLDFLSCGLILFTNDGDFAACVGHPRSEIEKEYIVEASGVISDEVPLAFSQGIEIEGVLYKAREVEKIGRKIVRICLVEGKNREIRRVFSHFHLHPVKLQRVRIGPVLLGNLRVGESRPLTEQEKERLIKPQSNTKEG
jgi:23S rRNA pseudouridine2605 synthase